MADKYGFVSDYAPQVWLSETDDGYWPSDLQTFFNNTKREVNSYQINLQTRIPLKNGLDTSLPFFHGTKPINGVGPPVPTFIWPINADKKTETDPLEMLLNPELNEIQVVYFFFFNYDYVSWHIDQHVADLEHA